MRVIQIIQDVATMEVVLRGWLFGRTRAMNGLLPNKMNEVCLLMQVNNDDLRGPDEQGLEEVGIDNVIKRRGLRLTNQPFPDLSFRENNLDERDIVEKERVLVCRWQYICYFADARARHKNSSCETALLRLRKEQCDANCAVEDDDLRTSWRGLTIKGGSVNVTKALRKSRYRTHGVGRPFAHTQMYNYGDGFCGAGGASRGATMAHLKVCWGFDMDEKACDSWELNWPEAKMYRMIANEFALDPTINAMVDILHISPPCQPFSPAHTRAGRNDEMNTASSFVIFTLLDKAKPRIVTIENTFGLQQRHKDYLHGIIHQFTSKGFSVRWKIMSFSDYGLPQSRRRLVIIASWHVILNSALSKNDS